MTLELIDPAVYPANMPFLLNERAAAQLLNCSVAFLRRCRILQQGPAYVKLGRLVRYRTKDLHDYVSAHVAEAA